MDQLPQQRDPASDGRPPADAERWDLLLAHRSLLMRVARQRTNTEADAEDCVSEALARAYEFEGLDTTRARAFLCTTVSRLAVDEHRRAARARAAAVREWTRQPQPGAFEEAVLDRAEGSWLVDRLAQLRGRERALLEARMSGQSVAEYAASAGISIGAAENAWTRIRHKALRALAVAGAIVTAFCAALRRPTAVAAPAAVALALSGFLLPAPDNRDAAAPEAPVGPAPTVLIDAAAAAGNRAEPDPPHAAEVAGFPARPAARAVAPLAPVDQPSVIAAVPGNEVPAVASLGGTRVERENEEETFEESVMRCMENVDLRDPLSDPCDY